MTIPVSLHIRPLTVADAPLLARVSLQAYRDHYLHLWHDRGAWYTQKCFTVEQLATELADASSRFFLIYAAEKPVGFLKLNLSEPAQSHVKAGYVPPADALELERIYFVRAATGQGIGSAVLRFVDDFARQNGKRTVWLKAMDSSTDALQFYRKNGYRPVGTHRLDFSQMKEEYWGMVILGKALPE